MKRRIAFVTVGRSDYSLMRPVWKAVVEAGMEVGYLVGGTHLVDAHGRTERRIEQDGAEIWGRIQCTLGADEPSAIAISMGLAALGYAQAIAASKPDLIVLLGDRYEMMAAATAASAMPVPLAHIHGGELTEGAIDERYRHAISKLSHLHFTSSEGAAQRLIRMGEEPWRVEATGAPGIDTLKGATKLSIAEAFPALGLEAPERYLLATLHPETVGDASRATLEAMLTAIDRVGAPVLFTAANADSGGQEINRTIAAFVAERPGTMQFVENCGPAVYPSMLANAAAMIGNSSSGLIEAPTFGCPAVNIGRRQDGRERSRHVIDVPPDAEAIERALREALDPERRADLADVPNPYGDGQAGPRISRALAAVEINDRLLRKRFHE